MRKPPKVSRGCGGVARAARAALAQRGPGGFKNIGHSSKSEVAQFPARSPRADFPPAGHSPPHMMIFFVFSKFPSTTTFASVSTILFLKSCSSLKKLLNSHFCIKYKLNIATRTLHIRVEMCTAVVGIYQIRVFPIKLRCDERLKPLLPLAK